MRLDGVEGNFFAGEDEVAFVSDDPFADLSFGEFHGLSHTGGQVDVILFAGFAADELNFGWVSHRGKTSYTTRLMSSKKLILWDVFQTALAKWLIHLVTSQTSGHPARVQVGGEANQLASTTFRVQPMFYPFPWLKPLAL